MTTRTLYTSRNGNVRVADTPVGLTVDVMSANGQWITMYQHPIGESQLFPLFVNFKQQSGEELPLANFNIRLQAIHKLKRQIAEAKAVASQFGTEKGIQHLQFEYGWERDDAQLEFSDVPEPKRATQELTLELLLERLRQHVKEYQYHQKQTPNVFSSWNQGYWEGALFALQRLLDVAEREVSQQKASEDTQPVRLVMTKKEG